MILIDNMEMPKNCAECRFWSVCRALSEYPDYESILTNEIIGDDGKRHSNCPLHEVTDPDTVSRQDVITLVENIENRRLKGEIDLTYAPMLKGVKALPPSPSRPQEHEKSCEGCEWEDSESEGCPNCARFYVDFYYEKRNGGAV